MVTVRNRRFFFQAATLVFSAVLCASVANAFASRERRLNLFRTAPAPVERSASPLTIPDVPPPAPAPATETMPPAVVTATIATPAAATIKPAEKTAERAARSDAAPPAPSIERQFLPHPDKPWVEIDPESVRQLYARGVLFVDARRTSVFEQGHIRGARSIPVWESDLDDRLNALYQEGLDTEAPIVVYCSGGNCEDSHMLGQRLWGIGFNNVLVYKDGYPDWVNSNGPIETGPEKR